MRNASRASKLPSVYVCSTTSFSGKSALCLGLALKFREEGYKVGYFKPLGWEMTRGPKGVPLDEDAQLMKGLLELDLPIDTVVPVMFNSQFLEESSKETPNFYEKKIFDAYEEASEGMDLMILEGPHTLGTGASVGIDPVAIAERLETRFLLVSRMENDAAVDQMLKEYEYIKAAGADLLGGVLNYVPKLMMERVKRFAIPILEKRGIKVLGIMPENIPLRAPTVREIHEVLGGAILACEYKSDNLVEDFLVGAMTPESALQHFRRSVNKAVITGGDRSDIQLAALQTSTSVLILTGNLQPDVRVLARAEELGVPILLVPYDTYTTVMKIATVSGRIKLTDTKKIDLAKKSVEEHVDWRGILKSLTG